MWNTCGVNGTKKTHHKLVEFSLDTLLYLLQKRKNIQKIAYNQKVMKATPSKLFDYRA